MGLETVELVMDVEDRFNVDLRDDALSRVRTVADLAAMVISQLPKSPRGCPTARSFFALRTLLATQAGIARGRIRPAARLDELFRSPRRRLLWAKLRKSDGRIPRLVVGARHQRALSWLTGILVVCCLFGAAAIWIAYDSETALLAAGCALLLGVWAMAGLSELSKCQFPTEIHTIADLVRAIAITEMPEDGSGQRLVAEQGVLHEIRTLIAEELGLPLEQVQPHSEFVKDLRMS